MALFLFFIYIHIYFFPFFSFWECVCVYFFVWFCLYRFTFTICPRVLSVCLLLVSFLVLVIIGGFVYCFDCSLLFFYKFFILIICIFKFFMLITLFYYFLSLLFFYFLPFLLSRLGDRVLVLRPGVRPEPLRWENRVQDIGPPETYWPHIISIGESSPRDLHLNAKTHSTQWPASPVLDTLCQTTSKTGTQPHPLAERLPKIIVSSQTPQNIPLDAVLPTRKTKSSLIHQNTGTSPSTRKPTQRTEPTIPSEGRTQNNGNYEPAACEKETPNTVS